MVEAVLQMDAVQVLLLDLSRCFGLDPGSVDLRAAEKTLAELCDLHSCDPQYLVSLSRHNEAVMHALAAGVVVPETWFLRDRADFDKLAVQVRAAADGVRGKARTFRSVSLGCASGEEAYSMAAIAMTELEGHPAGSSVSISILGADISSDGIQRARGAVYRPWSFRNVPEEFCHRFFTLEPDGSRRVTPDLQEKVQFDLRSAQGLLRIMASASVDALFFRNVAIYLRRTDVVEIYDDIARVLKDDSLFIRGAADPVPTGDVFVRFPDGRSNAYRRRPRADEYAAELTQLRARSAVPSALSGAGPTEIAEHGHGPPSGVSHGAGENEDAAVRPTDTLDAVMARCDEALRSDEAQRAVHEIRRYVFLVPGHRLARMFYALVLHQAGDSPLAVKQLRRLEQDLRHETHDTILEDGETCVGELRNTVSSWLERLV